MSTDEAADGQPPKTWVSWLSALDTPFKWLTRIVVFCAAIATVGVQFGGWQTTNAMSSAAVNERLTVVEKTSENNKALVANEAATRAQEIKNLLEKTLSKEVYLNSREADKEQMNRIEERLDRILLSQSR